MNRRVSRAKKVQISKAGLALMNADNNLRVAFDQIKDIVLALKSIKHFEDDEGLKACRRLIGGVYRTKNPEKKLRFIKMQCRPWVSIFSTFKEEICEGSLDWLEKKEIVITVGTKKDAKLRLSYAYNYLFENSMEDHLGNMEANLFVMFKNLATPGSKERKALESICEDFEDEEEVSDSRNAIRLMSRKLKGKINSGEMNMEEGEAPPINQIFSTLLEGGEEGLGGMVGGLMDDMMSGRMSFPDVVGIVKDEILQGREDESTEEEDDEEECEDLD